MTEDLLAATVLSLRVSLAATVLASLVGIPLGTCLGSTRFPGRRTLVVATNALMAVPTVLIGLLVYALLSKRGPLGPLGLLYTPTAMIFGEALLALPLIVALSRAAVENLDVRAKETAVTLGAGPFRTVMVLANEARPALLAAILGAFGRVVSELGIALMVGGNIRGETRTLTTTMTLATSRGDFELAAALGVVLLVLALGVVLLAEVMRR
ncbi:MAG: ABC transporter permease [Deltaproteobacteria bacterium]|nr:ABC transporter permease [Deltaproteobacteria bacterium]